MAGAVLIIVENCATVQSGVVWDPAANGVE